MMMIKVHQTLEMRSTFLQQDSKTKLANKQADKKLILHQKKPNQMKQRKDFWETQIERVIKLRPLMDERDRERTKKYDCTKEQRD